jgi:hypothetical protein
MHEKYGPVIRTNPDDVHIHDPDFFDSLYTLKLDKLAWWTRGFAVPTAGGMTVDETMYRKRRGALNPFFSKASILQNLPVIQEHLGVMCSRLDELVASGQVLDLESIFLAVTTDVLTQRSYGWSYGYIHNPEWAMIWKLVNTGRSYLGRNRAILSPDR